MAVGENLGASFSIDVTNLKAGLAQANRLIRESESQFKASAAGMDDWTTSAEGVESRLNHLYKATDIQVKKVDALKNEYERLISEGLDPYSKKAVTLRTDINKEIEALEKNRKEVAKQEETLKKLEKASKKGGKGLKKLGDDAKDSADGFTVAKGAVAGFIANGLTALVSKLGEAVSSMLSLSDATREYRSSIATLNTNAERTGVSTEIVGEAMKSLSGIVDDTGTSVEALSNLMEAGFDNNSLGKAVESLSNAVVAFPDTLKIESLSDGLQESIQQMKMGNDATGAYGELLERLGYNLKDVTDKFSKLKTEEEQQEYLLGLVDKKLAGTAKSYREQNKELVEAKEAQFDYNEALAEMGESMEPVSTEITNFKTKIISEFLPAITGIGDALVGVFNGEEGAAQQLATSINGLLTQAITKIIEMLPQFAEVATQLILLLAQTIIDNLPALTQAAVEIIATLVNSISEMLPTLVPAIVDAVILIVETLIDNLDLLVDAGINLILSLADGLIEAVPKLIDKIPYIINKLITAIVSNLPKLLAAGIELIVKLGAGMIVAIPKLLANIPQIWAAIIGGFMDGIKDISEVGKDIIEGLWEGITSMGDWISKKLKGFGDSVLSSIKNFFGIHSPSRVFRDEIGKNLALGIGEGFEDNIKGVKNSMVKSMDGFSTDIGDVSVNANGKAVGGGRNIVVNQYNTYSQAHSRYELFKTKQQTASAVRLAIGGAS